MWKLSNVDSNCMLNRLVSFDVELWRSYGLNQVWTPAEYTRGKTTLLVLLLYRGKLSNSGGKGCFISWLCMNTWLFVKRGEWTYCESWDSHGSWDWNPGVLTLCSAILLLHSAPSVPCVLVYVASRVLKDRRDSLATKTNQQFLDALGQVLFLATFPAPWWLT